MLYSPDTPMTNRLAGFARWLWSGGCMITDQDARLIPLKPNYLQKRIFTELMRQARLGQPIRLVALKARKEGFSTFVQALWFYLSLHTPHWSSQTVAHTDVSTRFIGGIAARASHVLGDSLVVSASNQQITFEHDSIMTTGTAGGRYVSSGATHNVLHLSELAKWTGDKAFVQSQLASIIQSVPKTPNSIIILESTANMLDTSGQFRAYWDAAGKQGSRWGKLFASWFDYEGYRIAGSCLGELTEYEKWLQSEFRVDDDQLGWRRATIAEDFVGDERLFKQEFPATEEEAFQAPSGLIYPTLRAEVHGKRVEEDALAGYDCYRAIDFGASDAFVCLWVAHRPGAPGLSVDIERCSNTWRELTGYAWGSSGRPRDADDHTCDALRYVITYYGMSGHVHVYRELYERESAARGMSLLDLASLIKQRSPELRIMGTVADRSQPGAITLLNQQGIPAESCRVPERVSDYGEKIDGIMRVQTLIIGGVPLSYPPEPEDWRSRELRALRESPVPTGICSSETLVALNRYEQEDMGRNDPDFGAY